MKEIQEIRDWMRENKLTQNQVAELAQMKQSAISRLLKGNVSPTLSTLSRIRVAIGMDAETHKDEQKPKYFNCVLSNDCLRYKTEGCSSFCPKYIER